MIRINNLSVTYKDKVALNIDREIIIEKGDRVGVIGSNGAGKTTLLKSILGIAPFKGEISTAIPIENIAVHMQQNDYIDTVPVRIIMEMIMGAPIKNLPLMQEMIRFFDFEQCLKKRFKTLSGGQKQRLTLILVICQESPITMFDEVTSGLDFETRQRLMAKLAEWYASRDTTLMITSHYYTELENLATKILFLDDGKVVDYGENTTMFEKYCSKAVIVFDASEEAQLIAKEHTQIFAPKGSIAISCNNSSEEAVLAEKLSKKNINFRRSNNDIEIMTINAKENFYERKNSHE